MKIRRLKNRDNIGTYSPLLLYMLIMCIVTMFYGCDNDEEPINDGTGVLVDGDMATLTFRVNEAFLDETHTRTSFKCDTVQQMLNDSLMIETVIMPDYESGATRATTTIDNTTILTVAYSTNRGKWYKRELSQVVSGRFAIHLPVGETYKLLFYAVNGATTSWNSFEGYFEGAWTNGGDGTSQLAGVDADVKPMDGEVSRDLIYSGEMTLQVNENTKLPAIDMKHLFCKAKLELTSTTGANPTSWTAVIGPQAYPKANSVDIALGSWVGAGTKQDTELTDNQEVLFIPSTTGGITLKYANVIIDGTTYHSSTTTTLTSTPFSPGTRYLISGKVTVRQEQEYPLDYEFYAWDAKGKFTWPLTEDSKPNGVDDFAQYSCKDCLTREEAIRMLKAGWYTDLKGPSITTSDGTTTHGIWVRKRDGWYTGEIDVNQDRFWKTGEATDAIRNSGNYVYFPVMGNIKRGGLPTLSDSGWWLRHSDGTELNAQGIPAVWRHDSGTSMIIMDSWIFGLGDIYMRHGHGPGFSTSTPSVWVGVYKEYACMRMIMP